MKWITFFFIHSQSCVRRLGRLIFCVLIGIVFWFPWKVVLADSQHISGHSPIEFSARLVWKSGGRLAKAQLFVKKDRYRLEPLGGIRTELGYAGITIVRLDEQKIRYVFSQRRMVLSVPLTSDYLLPFSVTLEGEINRRLIGDSLVGDGAAELYEVVVQDRFGRLERFFEWIDPERMILLKLLSQDRDWFVEYRHVVLSPQPDYFFETPLGYRIIEAQEVQVPRG
jgi:hypothetical protein